MIRINPATPPMLRTRVGIQRCSSRSRNFVPTPWLAGVFVGEQPANGRAELRVGVPHQDEGEQEIRDAQSDEAQEGEEIVARRVLANGGIDADRECDRPDQKE